jgi:hypothetical protein
MSNRIFDILPDINKLPDFPKDITDKTLYKYFKFDDTDIACIEKYKADGEGRLSEEKINEFLNFDIHKYIDQNSISEIQKEIEICIKNRPVKRQTRGKKAKGGERSLRTIFNKTRKNRRT